MDESIPVLNLQQIQQLAYMVRGIQRDNQTPLDDLIAESVDIQNTTIINLYNLTVEEWHKKQTIIDNLSTFTLTIMNTLQFLWEQKHEQEDNLTLAQLTIQRLEQTLLQLNNQNDGFKWAINQTADKLNKVTSERNTFEELYKSTSCLSLQLQITKEPEHQEDKKCSACYDLKQNHEEQHSMRALSQKLLQEKESEVSDLQDEKRRLQQEMSTLREEHELTKMEMQLAQIAIKDALTYKNSYISLVSNMQESLSQSKTSLNHKEPLLNSKILQQQPEHLPQTHTHTLEKELPYEPLREFSNSLNEEVHTTQEPSSMQLEHKEENRTHFQSPFRKKGTQSEEDQELSQSITDSMINCKDHSVVIFQSNIDMTFSSLSQASKEGCEHNLNPVYSSTLLDHRHKQRRYPYKKKASGVYSTKIAGSNGQRGRKGAQEVTGEGTNTIGRLYSMLSSKLVTNRIRKK